MLTFIQALFCNIPTNNYPDKDAILVYATKPNCEGYLCKKKGRGIGRGLAIGLLCKTKTLFF